MELQDSISKVAKMVWAKLQYTECKIKGENSTVVEIKDVWGLIKELEQPEPVPVSAEKIMRCYKLFLNEQHPSLNINWTIEEYLKTNYVPSQFQSKPTDDSNQYVI